MSQQSHWKAEHCMLKKPDLHEHQVAWPQLIQVFIQQV